MYKLHFAAEIRWLEEKRRALMQHAFEEGKGRGVVWNMEHWKDEAKGNEDVVLNFT